MIDWRNVEVDFEGEFYLSSDSHHIAKWTIGGVDVYRLYRSGGGPSIGRFDSEDLAKAAAQRDVEDGAQA